jgi:hypothetical protein
VRIQRLFTVGLVVAACVALAGCDWAQIGFGPGNTATNPLEAGLTEASVAHLHVAWSTACVCS